MGLTWMEWLMVFLGLKLMVAVGTALWCLNRDKDHRATICLVVALVYLALFVLAKNKAESEHELKHAAEHRAVQEQVKDVRHF